MYLYIGCNGKVSAIDPASGEEAWRRDLTTGFLSATAQQDVCVLEHQGSVFAGCNGHLFALDGRTGDVLWHNELKGMGYNDVTLAMAGKSVQVLTKVVRSS